MKKYIFILSTLLSSNLFADWTHEVYNNNGLKTYNTYAFDSSFESSISLSCDQDSKNILISILSDKEFSNKKVNKLKWFFNGEDSFEMIVPYSGHSVYFSKSTLKDNGNDMAIYNIIEMLKAKTELKLKIVDKYDKEFDVNFSLKGSSLSINRLLKNCNL